MAPSDKTRILCLKPINSAAKKIIVSDKHEAHNKKHIGTDPNNSSLPCIVLTTENPPKDKLAGYTFGSSEDCDVRLDSVPERWFAITFDARKREIHYRDLVSANLLQFMLEHEKSIATTHLEFSAWTKFKRNEDDAEAFQINFKEFLSTYGDSANYYVEGQGTVRHDSQETFTPRIHKRPEPGKYRRAGKQRSQSSSRHPRATTGQDDNLSSDYDSFGSDDPEYCKKPGQHDTRRSKPSRSDQNDTRSSKAPRSDRNDTWSSKAPRPDRNDTRSSKAPRPDRNDTWSSKPSRETRDQSDHYRHDGLEGDYRKGSDQYHSQSSSKSSRATADTRSSRHPREIPSQHDIHSSPKPPKAGKQKPIYPRAPTPPPRVDHNLADQFENMTFKSGKKASGYPHPGQHPTDMPSTYQYHHNTGQSSFPPNYQAPEPHAYYQSTYHPHLGQSPYQQVYVCADPFCRVPGPHYTSAHY
ncbi:hypothetical protein FQN57_005255 [Myotisia sp. PD_48]|nr:hypothetical protein FQN57_005255 [Myotisia sp. PD_48]